MLLPDVATGFVKSSQCGRSFWLASCGPVWWLSPSPAPDSGCGGGCSRCHEAAHFRSAPCWIIKEPKKHQGVPARGWRPVCPRSPRVGIVPLCPHRSPRNEKAACDPVPAESWPGEIDGSLGSTSRKREGPLWVWEVAVAGTGVEGRVTGWTVLLERLRCSCPGVVGTTAPAGGVLGTGGLKDTGDGITGSAWPRLSRGAQDEEEVLSGRKISVRIKIGCTGALH